MSRDLRAAVLADLAAESDVLDARVAGLDPAGWRTPTPAPGWTIAHQVGHLTWTDEVAVLAVTDPQAFAEVLRTAGQDPDGFVDRAAEQVAATEPTGLLARWRRARARLDACLRAAAEDTRVAWFGPPMSAASMATARLMETWAHGVDVADALGVTPEPTGRLRHVAHLGVRTREHAFAVRGLSPPAAAFRVELAAPDRQTWAWGPADAAQRVAGPALDFCLLVTQRRHRADLGVVATGADADRWLDVAQAFAGPPGPGREPAGTGGLVS